MLKLKISGSVFLMVEISCEATNVPFQRYKFELLEQMQQFSCLLKPANNFKLFKLNKKTLRSFGFLYRIIFVICLVVNKKMRTWRHFI